jgi:hypothetical protein
MRLRSTLVICAALAGALLFAAGCGDDNKDSGGLSSQEKLLVLQSRADIGDFCSLYQTEPSDLFDRSFESMLTAVRDLSRVYRENPDATVDLTVEKKKLTLQQIMQEEAKALKKCGKDGRQQAGVLEASLQQAQAKR